MIYYNCNIININNTYNYIFLLKVHENSKYHKRPFIYEELRIY